MRRNPVCGRLGTRASRAADLRRVWCVPLLRQFEDRQRWLATVRRVLEGNKIGWTMWDYQGGFGVVSKDSGSTVRDEGVLKALGLNGKVVP